MTSFRDSFKLSAWYMGTRARIIEILMQDILP
jgi:hypothetical protein